MSSPILRLNPFAVPPGQPPERPRRPAGWAHDALTLERARGLYETTTLPLREIHHRTGVSPATLSRHAKRGGWWRPQMALREEVLTPEGRRRKRRAALAEALLKQAEEIVYQLRMDPAATPAKLRSVTRLLTTSRSLEEHESPLKARSKAR